MGERVLVAVLRELGLPTDGDEDARVKRLREYICLKAIRDFPMW